MTAKLSCYVQNFVVVNIIEFRWDQDAISIEFELLLKFFLVKLLPAQDFLELLMAEFEDPNGSKS